MLQEMKNIKNSNDNQDLFGLPVDTSIMFSNHKNIYKQRLEKRQRKMLKKISFIKPFLRQGEKILFVTTGCSPVSSTEQLLTGWIVFYLKRSLFIFTNMRIFHIPTKENFSYRNSVAQILYADCRSITIKGRKLLAEYKSGKKENFIYIPRSEKKKINTLLNNIQVQDQPSEMLQRTHLCPRCTSLLIEDQYFCPNCSLEFKNKESARKISILYPGGGYFYTRHLFLGISDAFVEIYLTILVLAALVDSINGIPGSIFVLAFLSFLLAFEKALTIFHSNNFIKEFIPKPRSITMFTGQSQQTQSAPQPTVATAPTPEQILSASWRNS